MFEVRASPKPKTGLNFEEAKVAFTVTYLPCFETHFLTRLLPVTLQCFQNCFFNLTYITESIFLPIETVAADGHFRQTHLAQRDQ